MPFKDIEKRRQYDRERRRRKRAGALEADQDVASSGSDVFLADPSEQPFEALVRTVEDLRCVLSRQVAVLEAAEIDEVVRARAIGYLGGILLRALEAGEVERRLVALETAVAQRGGADGAATHDNGKEVYPC